ncbi:MAG: endonuclease/exonuclease/phosphatase family protein [Pararhodobacter sp.]
MRDIRREEPDVLTARDTLVALRPDAVLLLDIDHDRDSLALTAFAALLAEAGWPLPHAYAPRPNTGLVTGMDMDGDGRFNEGDDAQGWGRFSGAGAMALLSRWPIRPLTDHSTFLWRDLPEARFPRVDGRPFPSEDVFALQRLPSKGHWELALDTPQGPLTLLAWHAGPPAFGGPHQRNHWRNADETAFWRWRLDSAPPQGPFVLLGNSNLDPEAGNGERAEMTALLAHPLLQDPAPETPLPAGGPPTRANAHWPDGPGALRVLYLLPSRDITITDHGLVWPSPDARHAIVWADLRTGD